MFVSVPAGLDVAAITKLVVETVRERDESDFTHHTQTLEMGTTKVCSIKNHTDGVNEKKTSKVVRTKKILNQQLLKSQL